jgi:hypothetical protein
MRAIYQMPRAGQILSLAIPSRWAFEANLLNEAAAPEWGSLKPTPDITCTLGAALPTENRAPAASQGANPYSVNPSLNIMGDAAEVSIPNYILTAKDATGTEQTCRASADESFSRGNSTAHAVHYRRPFLDSMAVLGGMLLVLVAGVLAILRKRDDEAR